MRSGLLVFAVALLLFTVAVWAGAASRSVADTYRAWVLAHAERDPARVCALLSADGLPPDLSYIVETPMQRCVTRTRRELTPEVARRWRVFARWEVVEVDVDGDTATASLRSGSCTLRLTESRFRRAPGGGWRYDGTPGSTGFERPCREADARPPRF